MSGQTTPGFPLAHHFSSEETQSHAARLGMWIFLGTEILLFGGLFVSYAFYRYLYAEGFAQASRHLDAPLGTIETGVLLTSSLTAALAFHFAREGKSRTCAAMLAITILFGLGFIGIHSVEYAHELHEGALPGKFFRLEDAPAAGAPLFFALYFLMTGLHGLHVFAGLSVLLWMLVRAARGEFNRGYALPVEMAALYWHLVDLIWIFLFPLLYLI